MRNEDATFIFKGSSHSRTEMWRQNAPQTGAITGYLKVFGAKHIAKKKQKKWTINKVVKMKKEKEIVLIVIDMFLFVKHLI